MGACAPAWLHGGNRERRVTDRKAEWRQDRHRHFQRSSTLSWDYARRLGQLRLRTEFLLAASGRQCSYTGAIPISQRKLKQNPGRKTPRYRTQARFSFSGSPKWPKQKAI